MLALLELQDALNMLKLDSRGNSVYQVYPAAPGTSTGVGNCVGAISDYLTDRFDADYDVVVFSYDWRKSITNAARELQTYIRQRQYESVTFVCHSMGGLVCASYLDLGEENVALTRQVISVGTPFTGAPKAAYVLKTGDYLGTPVPMVADALLELARSYPSIYELLPYDAAIESTGSYLYRDGASMDAILTREFLESGLSEQHLQAALALQQQFYREGVHILNRVDVDWTIIAGYNVPTVTKYHTQTDTFTTAGISLAGDGTVPLTSAIEDRGSLYGKPVYLVDGVEHGALIADEDVLALVAKLIDPSANVSYDPSKITQPSAQETTARQIMERVPTQVYDMVIADGPVSLTLLDAQGNSLGAVDSKGIQAEAPEYFYLMNGIKQVIVPEGYTVRIGGEESATVRLTVAAMNPQGEIMESYCFADMKTHSKMAHSIRIVDHVPEIVMDINGDAHPEETLTGADAQRNVYISLGKPDTADNSRIWILIGISGGLVLMFAAALTVIGLLVRHKRKKKYNNP